MLNRSLICVVGFLFAGAAASASPLCNFAGVTLTCTSTYTFDTSSLNGKNGILDFNFNPGPGTTLDFASVTIPHASFLTDAILTGVVPSPVGDVTGGPLGTADLVLDNQTGFNDYEEYLTYGNYLDLTFSFSETVGGTADTGSVLAMSLFDLSYNPLLTTDQTNGFLLLANLAPCSDSGTCTASVTDQNNFSSGAVPEPGTWLLLSAGLAGLLFRRARETARG